MENTKLAQKKDYMAVFYPTINTDLLNWALYYRTVYMLKSNYSQKIFRLNK